MKIGKLGIIKVEVRMLKIDILGLRETRSRDMTQYTSDEFSVMSTGGEAAKRGEIILNEAWSKRIVSIVP